MSSVKEDGPHTHEPCLRCGVVEAEYGEESDGLCAECAVDKGADKGAEPVTVGAGERE
jgi:hypothetical protein